MTVYVNHRGEVLDMASREYAERQARYRAMVPQKRKPTVKNGYAAQPGTGPEGKTCKDCQHKHSFGGNNGGGRKTYIKCDLRRATWTNGEGTDILAGTPACKKFEAKA